MKNWLRAVAWAGCALVASVVGAAIVPEASRFDALVLHDPSATLGVVAGAPGQVDGWSVRFDPRTGTPMQAEGSGLRWFDAGEKVDAVRLETLARAFVASCREWMKIDPSQLALNVDGTGTIEPGRWVVVFDRVLGGVPVEGSGESVSGALSGRTDETRRDDRSARCYRTAVPGSVRGVTAAA